MHCLEVLIARNERAAGREQTHALNDGLIQKAIEIGRACSPITEAFTEGAISADQEG